MSGAAVARARALVGTRFRPQGRSARDGLDCVGLVAAALAAAPRLVPRDYALRSGDRARAEAALAACGLEPAAPPGRAGDVAIVRAGAGQIHLALLTEGGCIHADAGIGRVVERPGPLPWPVEALWRAREE